MDKDKKDIDTFLFTIQNLNAFNDIEIKANWSLLRTFTRDKKDFYGKSLLVESAHTPFYMNQTFTFKKFTNITKEDIYNCTKYLTRKILDCWMVWNYDVIIPPKTKREQNGL